MTIKDRLSKSIKDQLSKMPGFQYELAFPPLKLCAWCDGVYVKTPTEGRLECNNCGSVCLDGHRGPRAKEGRTM